MTSEELAAKLTLLRANLEALERLPKSTLDEFMSDERNLDYALHKLQTAIQVLIDLAGHQVASAGLPAPDTSRGLLTVLEAAGRLPEGTEHDLGALFAFRNRIVHLYGDVDAEVVHEVLVARLGDIEELARRLVSSDEPR